MHFFLFSRQITNNQNPETSTTLGTRYRTKIKKNKQTKHQKKTNQTNKQSLPH